MSIGALLLVVAGDGSVPLPQVQARTECPAAAALVEPDQPLDRLLKRAKRGVAIDQYRLGLRYEAGVGVPQDVHQARRLYEAAARQQAGPRWAYSPAVGSERHGRVVSGGSPRRGKSASEAEARLICLDL